MYNKFLNAMRLQASLSQNGIAYTKLGKVTAYNPDYYMVQVLIDPEDPETQETLETGWIPVLSPWVGNNWGLFCPPSIDDLVEVHFQEGSLQNPYCCMRFFNDENRPMPVPSGEFWLVHSSGSFIKMQNNGNISINAHADHVIDVTGDCTINASSIKLNSNDVELGDTASGLLKLLTEAAENMINTHVHTVSGSMTGPPTTSLPSDAITQNVKAN